MAGRIPGRVFPAGTDDFPTKPPAMALPPALPHCFLNFFLALNRIWF